MLSKAVQRRFFGAFTGKRNPSYSAVTDRDIQTFEKILGSSHVITDEDQLDAINTDWTRKWKGKSRLALKPGSTEEIARVLKYCTSRQLAVVP